MKQNSKFNWLFLLFFAVVSPLVPAILIWQSLPSFGKISDLPEFYTAATLAACKHGAEIYLPQVLGYYENQFFPVLQGRIVWLYVNPVALPWLMPLSMVSIKIIPFLWTALLLAAVLISLLLLKNTYELTWKHLLCIWSVLAIYAPLYESLRIGQLASLLLLALCVLLWALKHNRPVLAALAMSFLLLKPQELLPILVFLLGAKYYRSIFFFALISLVLFAISFAILGHAGYSNYFNLLTAGATNAIPMQTELHPNIQGQLLRLLPDNRILISKISAFVCIVALSSIFMIGRSCRENKKWFNLGLAITLPLGLVTSLYCHDYDLLLLLPAFVILSTTGLSSLMPEWLKLVMLCAAIPFCLPLYITIHYGYLLHGGIFNPLFFILFVFALLLPLLIYQKRHKLFFDS